MAKDTKVHWERIYRTTGPTKVGWFQRHPATSLGLITSIGLGKRSPIIDVGGGASRLVDELLNREFENLSVLDISPTALEMVKSRLKEQADRVNWIAEDVTEFSPPRKYDLWHDRALFHFLTKSDDRERYIRALEQSLAPGGHLVIGTFGPCGPQECSGLDVMRFSAGTLSETLGKGFELLESVKETHRTPTGVEQEYLFCCFRKNLH